MTGFKLDPYHRYQYHRNQLKTYSTFIVGAKLDKPTEKSIVSDAVLQLFNGRSLLRTNAFAKDGTLYADEIPHFPEDSCIQFIKSDKDIVDVVNELHDFTFKLNTTENPTWKVVVLNQQWVLVLCDHLFFDGTSGALIIEDLIATINGEPIISEETPDMSKFDQLVTPSNSYFVEKVLKEYTPKCSQKLLNWIYGSNSEFESTEVGWRYDGPKEKTFRTFKHLISINNIDFSKIKRLTSEHDVKFSAFWTYLNIVALSKLKKEGIEISIPCNLRAFLPKEFQKVYGLMVSHAAPKLKPETKFDSIINWEYVQFIHSTLSKEALKKNAGLIGMVKYIDSKEVLKKNSNLPRQCTFEFSNLGLRSFTKSEWCFKPEEFIFSQSNSQTGAIITNSAIASPSKVNILVEGVPESKTFFERYVALLEAHLKEILDSI